MHLKFRIAAARRAKRIHSTHTVMQENNCGIEGRRQGLCVCTKGTRAMSKHTLILMISYPSSSSCSGRRYALSYGGGRGKIKVACRMGKVIFFLLLSLSPSRRFAQRNSDNHLARTHTAINNITMTPGDPNEVFAHGPLFRGEGEGGHKKRILN